MRYLNTFSFKLTVEVSSIRKCIQLIFNQKYFVFDSTRMRHICIDKSVRSKLWRTDNTWTDRQWIRGHKRSKFSSFRLRSSAVSYFPLILEESNKIRISIYCERQLLTFVFQDWLGRINLKTLKMLQRYKTLEYWWKYKN